MKEAQRRHVAADRAYLGPPLTAVHAVRHLGCVRFFDDLSCLHLAAMRGRRESGVCCK